MTACDLRFRQLPLAIVMVSLTTLTLWSLGQAIIVAPTSGSTDGGAGAVVARVQPAAAPSGD